MIKAEGIVSTAGSHHLLYFRNRLNLISEIVLQAGKLIGLVSYVSIQSVPNLLTLNMFFL